MGDMVRHNRMGSCASREGCESHGDGCEDCETYRNANCIHSAVCVREDCSFGANDCGQYAMRKAGRRRGQRISNEERDWLIQTVMDEATSNTDFLRQIAEHWVGKGRQDDLLYWRQWHDIIPRPEEKPKKKARRT
jgi:hypothetical protein